MKFRVALACSLIVLLGALPVSAQELALDAGLMASVNEELGRDLETPVTVEELAQLSALRVERLVEDWAGIEHATNLKSLRLEARFALIGNYLEGQNIGLLGGLTALEELVIQGGCGVTVVNCSKCMPESDQARCPATADLTFLNDLPNLHTLELVGFEGLGLSPLYMESLRRLSLEGSTSDLADPAAHFPNLESLAMGTIDAPVPSDIGVLEGETLPFENLVHLRELAIGGAEDIQELIPLILQIPGLERLSLKRSGLQSIEFLRELPGLQYVNLDKNFLDLNEGSASDAIIGELTDDGVEVELGEQTYIEFVPDLGVVLVDEDGDGLTRLNLRVFFRHWQAPKDLGDWTFDPEPVSEGSWMVFEFGLGTHQLTASRTTDGVTLSRSLDVFAVAESPIAAPELRQELSVTYEQTPGTEQTYLGSRSLSLQGENIESLEGFQYFKWLEELDLRDNAVTDLTPLEGLSHLRRLDLRGNPIKYEAGAANRAVLEKIVYEYGAEVPFTAFGPFESDPFGNVFTQHIGWLQSLELNPTEDAWTWSWTFNRFIYLPLESIGARRIPTGIWFFLPHSEELPTNEGAGTWLGYPVVDEVHVNTGDLMGWIIVPDDSGWIWSWETYGWLYGSNETVSGQGLWIYAIK